MTLENTAVAEPAGLDTAPAPDSNDLETRFAGILDLDNPPAEDTGAAQPEDANATDAEPNEDELPAELDDPWAGYEDFEWEGKTVKIPTEMKDGYLRQADYTRKTQEVAEQRRQVEARAQELQAQAARSEEEFNAAVALHQVTNALQQFGDINWAAEAQRLQNDPLEFQELQARYLQFQALDKQRQQIAGYLQNVANERNAAVQQDLAKRLAETRAFAEKNIKGWTPELDGKITEFATKDLGFSVETLKNAYSPEIYKTLHLAYLGKQTLERQRAAKPATPPPQKTTTVSGKANPQASFDPEASSMADYVAQRKAGKIT